MIFRFFIAFLLCASFCATAYSPISGTIPQYSADGDSLASGYYLKGYAAGTNFPIQISVDSVPSQTMSKARLNSLGYPISNPTDESTVFIPHFDEAYKLVLYRTAEDADNNNLSNAVWVVDGFPDPDIEGGSGGGGSGTPDNGSITQLMLDTPLNNLLAQIGINTTDLNQEIQDRANAILVESQSRAAEIQAAVDAAEAGDTALRDNIDAVTVTVSANTDGITAQDTRITAVERNVIDVYDDGSDVSLTSFATSLQSTQAAVENPTTGLSATRNLAVTTETRLNNVGGVGSGTTVEDLTADVAQLQSDVASGIGGAASVQSVNEVSARVDGVEDRLNDPAGDGSVNIESMASSLATTSANATQAGIDAGAAVSTANAATARLNNLNDEPEIVSIAGQITTVTATATQAADDASAAQSTVSGLSASVTSNSTAIADLENGVAAQWEVQASAGAVTGSVGLYNDGGTTKFLIKADQIEADRGNGPESLFDADGLLSASFFGIDRKVFRSGGLFNSNSTPPRAGTAFGPQGLQVAFTDLDFDLEIGFYEVSVKGVCAGDWSSSSLDNSVLTLGIINTSVTDAVLFDAASQSVSTRAAGVSVVEFADVAFDISDSTFSTVTINPLHSNDLSITTETSISSKFEVRTMLNVTTATNIHFVVNFLPFSAGINMLNASCSYMSVSVQRSILN